MRWGLLFSALAAIGCGHSSSPLTTDAPGDGSSDGGGSIDHWSGVAAGTSHTCALRDDGTLWCWGNNRVGAAAQGTQVEVGLPAAVGTGTYLLAAAMYDNTCAIASDHSLWCWGDDQGMQLGQTVNGRLTLSATPVAVPGSWSAIAIGYQFMCGLQADASLWCWGYNNSGDGLGTGATSTQQPPIRVGSASWQAIAAGRVHTCAIQADASLWCWGNNYSGQLGMGTGDAYMPEHVGTDSWRAIAAAETHTCGITASGHLMCWGDNAHGELGDGTTTSRGTPAAVTVAGQDYADWTWVGAGGASTCATRSDGSTWCWGDNQRGQLAIDGVDSQLTPVLLTVVAGEPSRALAVGPTHSCAVAADGTMWCAGADSFAQLGDGGTSHRTPTKVAGTWSSPLANGLVADSTCALDATGKAWCAGVALDLGNDAPVDHMSFVAVATSITAWTEIVGSAGAVCGRAAGGSLWCWGANAPTLVGTSTTPLQIGSGAWTAAAPSSVTCAIASNGTLWCWGNDDFGETGNPATGPRQSSVLQAGTDNTWTAIATGTTHACGLSSGGLSCWGSNAFGMLGTGSPDGAIHTSPVPVSLAATSIYCGYAHSCGLVSDGHAYCWGLNYDGQLGLGTTTNAFSPTLVPGLTWRRLSLGAKNTCGIASDGSLYCWGDNNRGQLGDGTFASQLSPTQIGTDTDWDEISVGGWHACATKTDHTLWCWGSNDHGELADGTGWRASFARVVQ